jgi:Alw26I/Eco31I/Esp3I family type II restriction m6 adenine DNA methyltransferase
MQAFLDETIFNISTDDAFQHIKSDLLSMIANSQSADALEVLEKFTKLSEAAAASDDIHGVTRQRIDGIYYTSFKLARTLVNEAFAAKGNNISSFFEPCVGGGSFLFAFIDASVERQGISRAKIERILSRCYIADSDALAVENLIEAIPAYLKSRYGISAKLPAENIFVGDSLFQVDNSIVKIPDFKLKFGEPEGFDLIATNPPYRLLKKDRRQGAEAGRTIDTQTQLLKSSNLFEFIQGTPNIYKLYVEVILKDWLSSEGLTGLVIPRSLLTDLQSERLRKYLIGNFSLSPILELNEGNEFFKSVGQSFSAFVAKKGGSTDVVKFAELDGATERLVPIISVKTKSYASISRGLSLFKLGEKELLTLEYLAKFPALMHIPQVVNSRGEFDMSLDSELLTDNPSDLKLLQGSNLGYFSYKSGQKYVSAEILNRPKGTWINKPRIACQQISNVNQIRRLKWAVVPPGFVLANSCNFISVNSDELTLGKDVDLYYLLGILNSDLLNARFKLLSPNNHVSNSDRKSVV